MVLQVASPRSLHLRPAAADTRSHCHEDDVLNDLYASPPPTVAPTRVPTVLNDLYASRPLPFERWRKPRPRSRRAFPKRAQRAPPPIVPTRAGYAKNRSAGLWPCCTRCSESTRIERRRRRGRGRGRGGSAASRGKYRCRVSCIRLRGDLYKATLCGCGGRAP